MRWCEDPECPNYHELLVRVKEYPDLICMSAVEANGYTLLYKRREE